MPGIDYEEINNCLNGIFFDGRFQEKSLCLGFGDGLLEEVRDQPRCKEIVYLDILSDAAVEAFNGNVNKL